MLKTFPFQPHLHPYHNSNKRTILSNLLSIYIIYVCIYDADIIKVYHGMGGCDIQSLQRDFNIVNINACDTQIAAEALSLPLALAGLIKHYCHVDLTDTKDIHQRSDWRVRPLSNEQLK